MARHTPPATSRDLIVIGGSAGAIPVVQEILRNLPGDLPACTLIVIHQPQGGPGYLPWLFGQSGNLPVHRATDGEPLRHGQAYVAPPDHHLIVDPRGRMCLARGPKENLFRPAIDPLFRTAARAFGPRVVAVVLSGMLDDGTLGLMSVNRNGGLAIVQDPADATAPAMPASAVRNARVDHVLRSNEIAGALARLVREPPPPPPPPPAPHGVPNMSKQSDRDTSPGTGPGASDVAERGDEALTTGTLPGPPSGLTCPECGGALWEFVDGTVVHYRCHVGHRLTADSVAAAYDDEVESALWAAMRMFQENAALHRRLADRATSDGNETLAARHDHRSKQAEARTETLRGLLVNPAPPTPKPPPDR